MRTHPPPPYPHPCKVHSTPFLHSRAIRTSAEAVPREGRRGVLLGGRLWGGRGGRRAGRGRGRRPPRPLRLRGRGQGPSEAAAAALAPPAREGVAVAPARHQGHACRAEGRRVRQTCAGIPGSHAGRSAHSYQGIHNSLLMKDGFAICLRFHVCALFWCF